MKAKEGHIGRVFIIRLEDGDIVPGCIERFCEENKIMVGSAMLVGGIGGGEVVVGPRDSNKMPPEPMLLPVDGAHEIAAVGIIARGNNGKPQLHIHGALGRSGTTITGCLRPGVKTWVVGEVIIFEILDTNAKRLLDEKTGFTLLEPI